MPTFDEIEPAAPSFDSIEESAPAPAPSFAAIEHAPPLQAPAALGQLGFYKPTTPALDQSPAVHQGFTPNADPLHLDYAARMVHTGAKAVAEVPLKLGGFDPSGVDGVALTGMPENTLAREAMSPMVGQDFYEELPEPYKSQAQNEMYSALGPTGSAALQTGAVVAGNVPGMFLGLGWADRGAKAAKAVQAGGKVLPKILELAGGALGAGAEGAIVGGTQALVSGESVKEGAKSGGLFGATFHTLGSAGPLLAQELRDSASSFWQKTGVLLEADLAKVAKRGAKKVGMIVGNMVDRLAEDIGMSSHASENLAMAGVRHATENAPDHGEVGTMVRPGQLEPSTVLIHMKQDGSGVVASINEFTVDGKRKYYEMPIDTPEDANRVGTLAKDKNLTVGKTPDSWRWVADKMPLEIAERLWQKNTRPLLAKDSNIRGTLPEGGRTSKGGFQSLDHPSSMSTPDSVVAVGPDGHVTLSPLPDHVVDLSGLPEKGEAVLVIGRGGQKTPGTYHGIDSVTGKAVVNIGHDMENLDSITEVSTHSVVRAGMDEHVATEPPVGDIPRRGQPPKPLKKGDFGFIQDPNGGYLTVKVVGPGEKPGTLQVMQEQGGRPVTVMANKVDPRLPPGIESFDQIIPVQLDAPAPITPASMTPEDHAEVMAAERTFQHLSKQGPGMFEKISRELLGGQVRGSKVMQEMHLRNQGSQALLKAEADIYHAIEAQLPKGAERQAFNAALGRVFEGRQTWAEFTKKYGDGVSEQLKTLTGNLDAERTKLDQRIAEMGGIPDRLILERAEGLLDPYLARTYMVHLLPPGEWASRVRDSHPEVFSRAVEYLVKDLSENGKLFVMPEQVSAELEMLLKSGNVGEAIKGSGLRDSKAFKRLQARQELPKEIRDVMGEVTAGSVRMASTIGSQRAIVAKLELFQDIALDQSLSSIGRRADLHPDPVPDIPRLYGKLAGKYVTPDVYAELINLPQTIRNAYTLTNQVAGWIKGNQLMGFGPWWTSLMGNVQGGVFSGGLSFLRPDNMARDIHGALKALKDYHLDPTGRTGDGWLLLEAKKAGADWAGRGEVEISSHSRKFVKELLATLDGKKGAQGGWSIINTIKTVAEKYQGAQGGFGNMLDAQDQFFRLANYSALRRKFIAQGMPVEEAAMTAARRIAASFPNPENVGPALRKLRSQVGIAAPYITPKMEDLRIYGQLPKRLAEEPDLKWRLAGHAVVFGAIGTMLKHWSGVSDAALNAAQESMTKKTKTFKPLLIPLPARDARGRVQFLDISNWFLPGQLMQGHPDDQMFNKIAYNLATSPIEGSLLQNATDTMAEKAGIKRPVDEQRQIEGDNGRTKLVDALFKLGFGPRYLSTLMDLGRRTEVPPQMAMGPTQPGQPPTIAPQVFGQLGRNEEPLTMGQAATQNIGIRTMGAGDRGAKAAKMERVGEILKLVSEYKSVESSNRDPEEKKHLVDAITARINALGSQSKAAAAALKAAKEQK